MNRDPNLDELIGADPTRRGTGAVAARARDAPRGGPAAGVERQARGGADPRSDPLQATAGRKAACVAPPRRGPGDLRRLLCRLRRREPPERKEHSHSGAGPGPQGNVARAAGGGNAPGLELPGRQQLAHDAQRRRPAEAAAAQLLRGLPLPGRKDPELGHVRGLPRRGLGLRRRSNGDAHLAVPAREGRLLGRDAAGTSAAPSRARRCSARSRPKPTTPSQRPRASVRAGRRPPGRGAPGRSEPPRGRRRPVSPPAGRRRQASRCGGAPA